MGSTPSDSLDFSLHTATDDTSNLPGLKPIGGRWGNASVSDPLWANFLIQLCLLVCSFHCIYTNMYETLHIHRALLQTTRSMHTSYMCVYTADMYTTHYIHTTHTHHKHAAHTLHNMLHPLHAPPTISTNHIQTHIPHVPHIHTYLLLQPWLLHHKSAYFLWYLRSDFLNPTSMCVITLWIHWKQNLRTEFNCNVWYPFPYHHSCSQFCPTSHTTARVFIPIMHWPRSDGAQRPWTEGNSDPK